MPPDPVGRLERSRARPPRSTILGARPLLARVLRTRCALPMPPDPVGQLERSRARPPPLYGGPSAARALRALRPNARAAPAARPGARRRPLTRALLHDRAPGLPPVLGDLPRFLDLGLPDDRRLRGLTGRSRPCPPWGPRTRTCHSRRPSRTVREPPPR